MDGSGATTHTSPPRGRAKDVPIADFPRHESPWGTTERLDQTFALAAGDASLALDFTAMTRDLA